MNISNDDFTEPDLANLWKAFRNGDKCAFEKIYRTYSRDLLNYGFKVVRDRKLVEDSIQDLFFELWQSRRNLSEVSPVKFYLFKALRYKIVRNAKTSDITGSLDEIPMGDESISFPHENYLIEMEMQSFQLIHLKESIEKLPKRQQEAINLRYYHNFSNDQIAGIMGVNYQSACKFIYSALKNLRITLRAPFQQ